MRFCIDPGHGMGNIHRNVFDPGIVSAGVSEAHVVMMYALTLKHFLVKHGAFVYLTRRNNDENSALIARPAHALINNCKYLISLHLNGGGRRAATGTEVFTANDESRRLAKECLDVTCGVFDFRNRGIKDESRSPRGSLHILTGPTRSCLLEIGFLPNPDDRAKVVSETNRIAWGEALASRLVAAAKENRI